MSAWRIFLAMFEAGLASMGGGAGTIVVAQRQWVPQYISPGMFAFAYGLGQITPGPISMMVTALGYQLGGLLGALAAVVGVTLPTWLGASAAARGMTRFAAALAPFMKGTAWIIAALMVVSGIGLVWPMQLSPLEYAGIGVAAIAVWRRVDPLWVLAIAVVAGVIWQVWG